MAVVLILLIAANAAPVLLARLLGSHWDWPVDHGYCWRDGQPWFGSSKTWRGIIVGVSVPALLAPLLQIDWLLGAALGALSMLGDLIASFSKRRLGIAVSGRAWLLDQLPEAVLPMLLYDPLGLSPGEAALVVVAFILLDIILSPLFYRWHLRNRPY